MNERSESAREQAAVMKVRGLVQDITESDPNVREGDLAASVIEALAVDERRELGDALLGYAIRTIAGRKRSSHRMKQMVGNRKDDEKEKGVSWRKQLDMVGDPSRALDLVVPSANGLKRLGDFRQEDVYAISDWYSTRASEMHVQSERFRRIARRLPNSEVTLEEAFAQGLLAKSERELLAESATQRVA